MAMMMACRSCALSTAFLMLAQSGVADEDATCNFADASCKGSGHVLLQKAFRSEEKVVVVQAPKEATVAHSDQNRSWYLSELGETCKAACEKNGMNFSYVLATEKDPQTPTLVGHIPSLKQEAWAALECYVPSEDRYHTANPNAAKHVDIDIGTWSHPSCKLACPCVPATGAPANTTVAAAPAATPPAPTATKSNTATDQKKWCRWRQPPACAPEFDFKGVRYAGCAPVDSDHDKPWCQFHEQHSEGDANTPLDWSYCTYGCANGHSDAPTEALAPAPLEDGCMWEAASSCVAEFDYEGTHYTGCTTVDHAASPWCSNSNPYNGSWSSCQKLCVNEAAEDVPKPKAVDPAPELEPELECAWEQVPECSTSFQYKGIDYTGCATVDHPTPWCSIDRVHKGKWTRCTRVCAAPVAPVTAVPVTSAPATTVAPALAPVVPILAAEDPCARHPEAENDALGATVTLDEAGYLIAAAAESPVNMKRFVCRAISKIGCRVSELSALMAFVPYYSGLVSHQTYGRLEAELTTLCHIGGKWVVPLSVDASGRAVK